MIVEIMQGLMSGPVSGLTNQMFHFQLPKTLVFKANDLHHGGFEIPVGFAIF